MNRSYKFPVVKILFFGFIIVLQNCIEYFVYDVFF